MTLTVALVWTLLFNDGSTQTSYTDPGLVDAKPENLCCYVAGTGSDVVYSRNAEPYYFPIGSWTARTTETAP